MERPICLFGPGRGYYRPWPGEDFKPAGARRAIRRVLRSLRSVVGGVERPADRSVAVRPGAIYEANPIERMAKPIRAKHVGVLCEGLSGKAGGARMLALGGAENERKFSARHLIQEVRHERNSQTIGHSSSDSEFSEQPWLFPDDAGVGGPARRQQGHRVSTHRRAGRQRSHSKVQAQGTLFGPD